MKHKLSATHTAKFLVGITPAGVVCYLSDAFPGSTSDKEIIVATKILDQLVVGDNVMIDEGFIIDDLLQIGNYIIDFMFNNLGINNWLLTPRYNIL